MAFYNSPGRVHSVTSLPSSDNPFPVIRPDGLPYNFYNTPFFGDPTDVTDPSSVSFTYNESGVDITVTWNEMVSFMQSAVTAGSGAGTSGEVTSGFLAARWQEFFYYFQPLVDNNIFAGSVRSIEDPGVTYANFSYYRQLFQRCFSQWMNYRRTVSSSDAKGSSLITYLKEVDLQPTVTPTTSINNQAALNNNMQYRQRSVMMWQFLRIVSMMQRLNLRAVHAGQRDVMWNQVNVAGIALMANTPIPATTGSGEDVTIPDPTSVALQNAAVITIEGYRGNSKTADQRAQMETSTLSFSSDAVAQQRQSLGSFWSSLDTIMNAILN